MNNINNNSTDKVVKEGIYTILGSTRNNKKDEPFSPCSLVIGNPCINTKLSAEALQELDEAIRKMTCNRTVNITPKIGYRNNVNPCEEYGGTSEALNLFKSSAKELAHEIEHNPNMDKEALKNIQEAIKKLDDAAKSQCKKNPLNNTVDDLLNEKVHKDMVKEIIKKIGDEIGVKPTMKQASLLATKIEKEYSNLNHTGLVNKAKDLSMLFVDFMIDKFDEDVIYIFEISFDIYTDLILQKPGVVINFEELKGVYLSTIMKNMNNVKPIHEYNDQYMEKELYHFTSAHNVTMHDGAEAYVQSVKSLLSTYTIYKTDNGDNIAMISKTIKRLNELYIAKKEFELVGLSDVHYLFMAMYDLCPEDFKNSNVIDIGICTNPLSDRQSFPYAKEYVDMSITTNHIHRSMIIKQNDKFGDHDDFDIVRDIIHSTVQGFKFKNMGREERKELKEYIHDISKCVHEAADCIVYYGDSEFLMSTDFSFLRTDKRFDILDMEKFKRYIIGLNIWKKVNGITNDEFLSVNSFKKFNRVYPLMSMIVEKKIFA